MRQRGQRQAIPDRAVAGHKKDMAPPQMPAFRIPPQPGLALPSLDGQHETRGCGQAAVKDGGQAMARLGVGQFAVPGGDIGGQVGFLEQPFARVLIGFVDGLAGEAETGAAAGAPGGGDA